MNAKTAKTIAWRVMDGIQCIGTVYYLERCSESHVTACVRHTFGRDKLTAERA